LKKLNSLTTLQIPEGGYTKEVDTNQTPRLYSVLAAKQLEFYLWTAVAVVRNHKQTSSLLLRRRGRVVPGLQFQGQEILPICTPPLMCSLVLCLIFETYQRLGKCFY
jgi:hypothetical protein